MKHIVKITKVSGNFRINIPKKLVAYKGWGNLRYLLLNDWPENEIIIERMLDETLKERRRKKHKY